MENLTLTGADIADFNSKVDSKEYLKFCKATYENKNRFTKLKSSPRRNNKSDRKKRRALLKLCKN